jgi:serine/threonine protein kinase/predicted Zn-dependent protease
MALAFSLSCPHCGADVSPGAAYCAACSRALSARQVAAGVLTPLPGSLSEPADVTRREGALTVLPGGLRDPDTTGLPPLSLNAQDAVTRAGELPTEFGVSSTSIGPSPDSDADVPTSIGPAALKHPVRLDDDGSEAVTHVPGQMPSPSDDASGPLAIGERFGSRYRITRLLGLGGMGAVYEAWDAELGVSVALKVVRPEIAGDSTSAHDLERRFKRELLLARQVTHKNVVRIHDLGEINGIKYITMPYIDGQDLGTILKTEGRLPIPRALSIARQALSGLVAAHAEGIVHRDLKPANIMVNTADQALLMDFGIARSIDLPADQITPGHHRTRPGMFGETMVGAVVGTIHYMAPEQAKGQTVDHRADIYAFGLILRDMLVGLDRRMGAPTAFAELQQRLDHAPPSLKTIEPAIPESLDRVVSRCVAPEAADRYQTTADLEADLNRLDDNGELIPIKRVVGLRLFGMVAALAGVLIGGSWYYARKPLPPEPDPVSVLIADFQNGTGDPTFDRTLEPMLRRALEGASFITAYDRSTVTSLGATAAADLNEAAARELAVKQGVGVVLSGSLERQGNGYGISVKAAQTVTGDVVADVTGRASSKDQVLEAAIKLVTDVRTALGDPTSDSAQMFAMASVSATSLEVLRHYATAREAASNGQFEEERQSYARAVELDPNFGIGYQALANVSVNLGNLQDADKYIKEALSHLDGMTERERYTTRGMYNRMTGDYQQCVKEYRDMIDRYPADVLAHNNLALCLTNLRDMPRALDEMRRVVKILPKRALFRINLALTSNYAGDFQAAEQEARVVQDLGNPQWGLLALAYAQLGQGQVAQAAESYQALAKINALGASQAASGLGDLAAYEGRFSDAVRILEQGAAADLTADNADRAAAKFASLAHVQLSRGQKSAAIAAAQKALTNSMSVTVRFQAARSFVEAGEIARARPLIERLASELGAEPQAYAKIVEGEYALKSGDPRQAIKVLTEANTLLDTWLGHFDLGRAYLEVGAFVQADSEFDTCLRRRGEALEILLEGEPTYAYLPQVYYYKGLVREALKNASFAESFREYLKIRGQSKEDSLLPEVRRRAGG